MTNIIKLGSLPISAFKVGNANCKIYLADTLLYPHSHVQEPCFAVVDDITQYLDRTYIDVFNEADEKWYKLNNLNQYEEYGVYGTSTAETQSRLPEGYTEVEYIRNSNYNAYINTGVILFDNTSNTYTVTTRLTSEFHSNLGCATIIACENQISTYYGLGYRYKCSQTVDELEFYGSYPNYSATVVDNGDGTRDVTFQSTGDTTWTLNTPLIYFANWASTAYTSTNRPSDATIYSATVVKNGVTVRDFVPAKRDSDDKYGLYDLITDTFYTSPNGNNFSGGQPVSNVTTYYQGKLAIVDDYEYMYSGSSWVNVGEVSGGTATLPNKSFVLNYNAKNYNATTHSIPYTSGQTKQVDAVQNYGSDTIVDHSSDGYISVTANTRLTVSGGTTSLSRTNTQTGCSMTIVSKVRTDDVVESYSVITNRGSYGDMNWMWRYPANGIFLHGSTSYNKVTYYTVTSASPITASVRVSWNGSVQQQINDWTNNGSYSGAFQYGPTSNSGALFCDYLRENAEFWKGDFYWVYLSQEVLTDEEIQQVITYNEGGGGEPIYPLEYTVMQDPPNNLTFSSMTEAEEYECPWVGMNATIDGDNYIFSGDSQSGYEWVEVALPYDAQVEYLESSGSQYIDTGVYLNTSNFEVGYTVLGTYGRWGYVHQNVADGAWVVVFSDYAYFGRWSNNNNYRVAVSSYLTYNENTIVYKQNGVTVNGTTLSKNLNLSGRDNLNSVTLRFFADYDFYKKGMEYGNFKFKSFYLKNNGTLVVDMIPVRVGQVGYMYDRVSGQLFGNAGSGQFILGPDV